MDFLTAVWLVRILLAFFVYAAFSFTQQQRDVPHCAMGTRLATLREGEGGPTMRQNTRTRSSHNQTCVQEKPTMQTRLGMNKNACSLCLASPERAAGLATAHVNSQVRLNTACTNCWCWPEHLYTYSMLAESNVISSACISQYLSILLEVYLQQILTRSLRNRLNISKSFNIFSFKLRVLMSILTPSTSSVVALLTLNDL